MVKVFGYRVVHYICAGLVLMTIAIVLLFSKISKAIPASSLYYCRVWSSFRIRY
jgi:hypothetical protein